mmetsp:Transcript_54706/g.116244  ORF Transcript_54706/g.116244 Transcript_54706/m.116244 type:complete len:276 (+) Transcript_54706:1222-2049(+)
MENGCRLPCGRPRRGTQSNRCCRRQRDTALYVIDRLRHFQDTHTCHGYHLGATYLQPKSHGGEHSSRATGFGVAERADRSRYQVESLIFCECSPWTRGVAVEYSIDTDSGLGKGGKSSSNSWLRVGRSDPWGDMENFCKWLPSSDSPPQLDPHPSAHIPMGGHLLREKTDPFRGAKLDCREILLLPAGQHLHHRDCWRTLDIPGGNHRPPPEATRNFGRDTAKAGGVFYIVANYKDFGGVAHGPPSHWGSESNGVFTVMLQQEEVDTKRVAEGGI